MKHCDMDVTELWLFPLIFFVFISPLESILTPQESFLSEYRQIRLFSKSFRPLTSLNQKKIKLIKSTKISV